MRFENYQNAVSSHVRIDRPSFMQRKTNCWSLSRAPFAPPAPPIHESDIFRFKKIVRRPYLPRYMASPYITEDRAPKKENVCVCPAVCGTSCSPDVVTHQRLHETWRREKKCSKLIHVGCMKASREKLPSIRVIYHWRFSHDLSLLTLSPSPLLVHPTTLTPPPPSPSPSPPSHETSTL